MVKERERDLASAGPGFDMRHRILVTSTVLAAVAFLEAAVNEVLRDAADRDHSDLSDLDRGVLEKLGILWQSADGSGPPFLSTLKKYQEVLRVAFGESRTSGHPLLADIELLIELQNHLKHFKPETQTAGDLDDFERKLRARFHPNPLMAASEVPFFPDRCLGSGCASWATESAQAFVDDFFAQLGVAPNYLRVDFGPAESAQLW